MNRLRGMWTRYRGWPGWVQALIAVVVVIIVIASAASSPEETTDVDTAESGTTVADEQAAREGDEEPESTEAPTTTVPPTTTTTEPPPPPQTLQGRGSSSMQRFSTGGGITIIRASHRGAENFIVQLRDSGGEEVGASLFNEIGNFDGSTAVGLPAGTYIVEVDADGAWTFTVEQPRVTAAPRLPQNFEGRGMQVVGPFQGPDGAVRFTFRHSGAENFIVQPMTIAMAKRARPSRTRSATSRATRSNSSTTRCSSFSWTPMGRGPYR